MPTNLMALGSLEHRDTFCQHFLNSHLSYDPDAITWPELSDDERDMLARLPIWTEAVSTEDETAAIVTAMASYEVDPIIAAAIAMQGREEARHAHLVRSFTEHYGLSTTKRPARARRDPENDFLWSGFGECIDSFVAFGLYAFAKDLGAVPNELLDLFDLVLQEEARHIVFFENWRHFARAQRHGAARVAFSAACWRAGTRVVGTRLLLSRSLSKREGQPDENFLLAGARSFAIPSPRVFLERCLLEHQRRLANFDRDLLRPRLVPAVAAEIIRAFRIPSSLRTRSHVPAHS